MKLYTEEEVRRIVKIAFWQDFENGTTEQDVIDMAHSVELPSDEEIERYVESTPYYGHCTNEFKEGIEDGAKWVIEQIKQQYNEQ